MEKNLYKMDLWKPLGGKSKKGPNMSIEDWDILDRKAFRSIHLCLTQSVAFNITKEKTTKELIKTLENLYEKPSILNEVFLMKHLFNINMVEGGSGVDHLNEFNLVLVNYLL